MAIAFEIEELIDNTVSVQSVCIDGEVIHAHGDDSIAIPKGLLAEVTLKDVDPRVWIEPADSVSDDLVVVSTVPYRLQVIGKDKARVEFDETVRRKHWDGPVGLPQLMQAKKAVIEDRQAAIGDISLRSYDDDGDYISLTYTSEIEGVTIGEVVEQAEQLATEVDGAADLAIGSPFKQIAECNSEKEFTLGVVIPLLRHLGFANVKYNHGKREYGKDITFARLTEFDEYERWGAQIKKGDVGGGVKSDIAELVTQAEDAFRMPYYDVYTRDKGRISKMLIVISGKFTENAVEKICEGIENNALRNNLVFIDAEKIEVLADRFRQSLR